MAGTSEHFKKCSYYPRYRFLGSNTCKCGLDYSYTKCKSRRQISLYIQDAKNHFKWLLDPLPVGVRVVISVGVNSCPEAWRQWPTLHLEPLSFQSVRGLVCQFTERARVQIPGVWVSMLYTFAQKGTVEPQFNLNENSWPLCFFYFCKNVTR